jgi:hypothetical protein
MRVAHPPVLATWLLEHLSAGEGNAALNGDLLEEFCHGRSASWYWRQAIAAILIGQTRQLCNRWTAVVFAALWSAFSPSLVLLEMRLTENQRLMDRIWRLDWPWSAIFGGSLDLSIVFSVLWGGLILHAVLYSCARKKIAFSKLLRGLLLAGPVYFALSVTMALIVGAAGGVSPMRPMIFDWRHATYMQIVMSSALSPFSLVFFATLLPSIWVSLPSRTSMSWNHRI